MPNWKKIIVSGSDAVLNSVTTSNGAIITGSLRVTGSIALVGNQQITGSLFFNPTDQNITTTGQIGWDGGNGTLDLGLSGSAGAIPTLNIGQQQLARVYNAQGTTITKGQVVYVSGSQGNRIAVKLAAATGDDLSAGTLGFVYDSIGAGAEGYVITAGHLSKVDTSAYTAGASIYLSSSAGQFTQTRPVAPIHEIRLGYIERVDNTVGSIYVKVDNGYELDELHDVYITSSTSGDLLVRSASLWINSKQLTGSYGLTGSLTATSFTGSLFGTASRAISASWAPMRPGGSDTQIQFNSGSTLAASQFFTFNYLSSSLQQGQTVSATGQYSHAEGYITTAAGAYSHAEGGGSQANGNYSHAEGFGTTAAGGYSHTEGFSTQANGNYSHAEGYATLASGSYSHTEGSNTTTYSDFSHAEGLYTKTANTSLLVASSSITLNAYNTGSRLLVGDYSYTSTSQTSYVLWEDVDNSQVWLSQIDNILYEDPDNQGNRPIFQISEFDSQGPDTNVASGGAVYDLASGTSTTGLTAYNYGKLDFDNELIEVYNEDLSIISAGGVLLTVPNSGSYAYDIISVTYSSNTSSISFDSTTNQFSSANSGAPSLTGAVINSGKVILTGIVGVTWAVEGYLISSPISAISHYNVDNKTIKIANSQNYTSVFTPGSYIYFNGDFRLVENSNYSGANTFVTTSVQLAPVYDSSNFYYIWLGMGSHAGGFYTIASGSHQTVVGQYNKQNNLADLFVVGGGSADNDRKDVFNVSTTNIIMSGSVNISGSLLVNGISPGGGSTVKAGSGSAASFGGSPLTSSITFTTPFSNNLYAITVTGEDARSWTIQSKVSGSFVINSNSSTALTGPVYWMATPFANS